MPRSGAAKLKVLFVSHNHPAVRPGGAEGYALELYEAMRQSELFEPIFLARTGPPISTVRRYHEGTVFAGVNGDPNQYFIYTDVSGYDWLNGRSPNKAALTRHFRDFLLAQKPDIVHFQHANFLGYDILRVTRDTLPNVPIVFTLHEYLPICHRDGQMLRTVDNGTCSEASPRRCHECFPQISPQAFFMRKRFIQSHFSLVDLFIAPSRFLLERFVDWGVPRDRIWAEPYGRILEDSPAEVSSRRKRNQFGFFGQLLLFKGINVLLRAVELAGERFDGHLWIHGANLDLQPQDFRDEVARLLGQTRGRVTLVGRYDPADLRKLMVGVDWVVVPSIWWENAPLVIDEAFHHGRPVICSDVGGMAEKVTSGVNGLHFKRNDPHDLARVLEVAAGDPQLWERLRSGIPSVHSMEEHMAALGGVYNELRARREFGAATVLPREVGSV